MDAFFADLGQKAPAQAPVTQSAPVVDETPTYTAEVQPNAAVEEKFSEAPPVEADKPTQE